MKRVKKPKGKGSILTKKQKNEIIMYVVYKLFPQYAALFLLAVKYVKGLTKEEAHQIRDRMNRYSAFVDAGILNINDVKTNLEAELDMKLDEILGSKDMFKEAMEDAE